MNRHRRLAQRILLTVLALGVAVAAVVLLAVPGAMGAYTARITNGTNTATTNPYFTCNDAADKDNAFITYPLNDTGYPTATDVSGGGRDGAYSLLGVSYNQPGPCPRDGGRAVSLTGLFSYVTGPNATSSATTYSVETWFKTSTAGGKLIGFGNTRTSGSPTVDRHVYMTNAGNLVFGVVAGGVRKVVTSPGTYADNTWHHVVATQAPAGNPNPGIRLYVDGSLVAADSSVVTNTNTALYLRIGYDSLTGWPSAPTNAYFIGSLAWASYYNTVALTPAQVLAHDAVG